jgi:hypothetical protein
MSKTLNAETRVDILRRRVNARPKPASLPAPASPQLLLTHQPEYSLTASEAIMLPPPTAPWRPLPFPIRPAWGMSLWRPAGLTVCLVAIMGASLAQVHELVQIQEPVVHPPRSARLLQAKPTAEELGDPVKHRVIRQAVAKVAIPLEPVRVVLPAPESRTPASSRRRSSGTDRPRKPRRPSWFARIAARNDPELQEAKRVARLMDRAVQEAAETIAGGQFRAAAH